jgi:hypothetical protein
MLPKNSQFLRPVAVCLIILALMLDLSFSNASDNYESGAQQLPGYRGKLIFWADATEIDRLRRLRQIKWNFGDPPIPSELTTPVVPQATKIKGKRKSSEDC